MLIYRVGEYCGNLLESLLGKASLTHQLLLNVVTNLLQPPLVDNVYDLFANIALFLTKSMSPYQQLVEDGKAMILIMYMGCTTQHNLEFVCKMYIFRRVQECCNTSLTIHRKCSIQDKEMLRPIFILRTI